MHLKILFFFASKYFKILIHDVIGRKSSLVITWGRENYQQELTLGPKEEKLSVIVGIAFLFSSL